MRFSHWKSGFSVGSVDNLREPLRERLLASVPNVRIALSQFPVDGTTLDGLIEAASDAFDDDTNLAASGQSFD